MACVAGLWFAPSPMTAQRASAPPPAPQLPPLEAPGPSLDPRTLTSDLPFPMARVALPRIPRSHRAASRTTARAATAPR